MRCQHSWVRSLLAPLSFSALAFAQGTDVRSIDVAGVRATLLPRAMSYAEALAFGARTGADPLAPPSIPGGSAAAVTTDVRIPLAVGIEGDLPIDVEITPDGSTALVVCRDSDGVEFFDVASGVRLGRVVVDDQPLHVALTPDGARALVSCVGADTLCIVDVAARTLVHSVANVGIEPYRAVATSDSARAIVGSVGAYPFGLGGFTVVDLATGQVVSAFATPVQGPVGFTLGSTVATVLTADFELTPDDQRIVLANYSTAEVLVYDVASGAALVNLSTFPYQPARVALDPAGTKAVVVVPAPPGSPASTLVVVDLQNLVTSTIPIASAPYLSDLVLASDARTAVFGAFGGLMAVDLVTGAEQTIAPGAYTLAAIEPTFDGRFVLVSMYETQLVSLLTKTVVASEPTRFVFALDASPVAHVAVGASYWLDENLRRWSSAFTSLSQTWSRRIGAGVELDGPSAVALTGDGLHAAVACETSNNVAFVDLEHRTVETVTRTNGTPLDVAVSPVANLALAALYDPPSVAVIDLALGQLLAEIAVSGVPREVAITPDGRGAVVRSSQPDTLTFLDVDGAATQIAGSLALATPFVWRMEMNPAGTMIALLTISPAQVQFVDLATRATVAVLPVVGQPLEAEFTSDGSRLVVGSVGTPNASVIELAGTPSVTAIATTLRVLNVALDAAGAYAYFLVFDPQSEPLGFTLAVRVFDLQTGAFVQTFGLPQSAPWTDTSHFPFQMERLGDRLVICESEFRRKIWRMRMAGAASYVEEVLPSAPFITYTTVAARLGSFVASVAAFDDELQLVRFGGDAVAYCDPATPNSTGLPARVSAYGTHLAGEQPLEIRCDQLPANKVAVLIFGNASASTAPPFGLGTLCVGGQAGRFSQSAQNSGASGRVAFDVDIQALPLFPAVAVAPGETWRFQVWYRDFVTAPSANLSSAVAVTFE